MNIKEFFNKYKGKSQLLRKTFTSNISTM